MTRSIAEGTEYDTAVLYRTLQNLTEEMMYDHIGSEFARDYLREQYKGSVIGLNLDFVDMCGNLNAGLILSRIVYWYMPGKNGKPRLRVEHEGELWLAKNHSDWMHECRLTVSTARRAIRILINIGVLRKKLLYFGGNTTPHYQIVWKEFEKRLQAVIADDTDTADEAVEDETAQNGQTAQNGSAVQSEQTAQNGQTVQIDSPDQSEQSVQNEQAACPDRTARLSRMDKQPVQNGQTHIQKATQEDTHKDRQEDTQGMSPAGDDASSVDDEKEDTPMPEIDLNSREALMKAVADSFDTKEDYGGFNGVIRTMLDGTVTGNGKWAQHSFKDEPVTAQELMGFAIWYRAIKHNHDSTQPLPRTPDILHDRILEFRGHTRYDDGMDRGLEALHKLLGMKMPGEDELPDVPWPDIFETKDDDERPSKPIDPNRLMDLMVEKVQLLQKIRETVVPERPPLHERMKEIDRELAGE